MYITICNFIPYIQFIKLLESTSSSHFSGRHLFREINFAFGKYQILKILRSGIF